MRNSLQLFITLIVFSTSSWAQSAKKTLSEAEYLTWNTIDDESISADGEWVTYAVEPAWGDPTIHVYNVVDGSRHEIKRGYKPVFDQGSGHLICRIKHPFLDLRALKRKKTKEKDLPGDTLLVLDLSTMDRHHFAHVTSIRTGENWGGFVLFDVDTEKDTTLANSLPRELDKKERSTIVLNLNSGAMDTLAYNTSVVMASDHPTVAIAHNSSDSLKQAMISIVTLGASVENIYREEGKTENLGVSNTGDQIGFVADQDSTKALIRPYEIFHWQRGGTCKVIGDSQSAFLKHGQIISPHREVSFSDDGAVMQFGISPEPVIQDTSLLDDEIVKVEVWSHVDGRLHTQQESEKDDDEELSYLAVYRPLDNQVSVLGSPTMPDVYLSDREDHPFTLASNRRPYEQLLSWEGISYKDIYLMNTRTGEAQEVARKIAGWPQMGPAGNAAVWYNAPDSAWFGYDLEHRTMHQLTDNASYPFFDEINDRPMHPSSYGLGGWTQDGDVLIYDRYDIWKVDPSNASSKIRLTRGRENERVHRIVRLDRDDDYVRPSNAIVHVFDRTSKADSYFPLLLTAGPTTPLFSSEMRLTRWPSKAENSDVLLFTQESYQEFPNLYVGTESLKQVQRISDANPQQRDYKWGSIELVQWTDGEGIEHEGMLAKPEGFDPTKTYPMIVNFYERSADGLHRHRAMSPGRSTISYPFYTSNGYVIFNPDIHYRVGHPGLSALEDVVSGTQHIIDMGFVDVDKIGLQGHSWGGYQIADIITRTNMFACAESGAPVVNMVSAYGGIRWGSGMSRMFQYEHTQSRLGGTLWEKPELYLENSPIFRLDKVETPVLIMHNDEDTAVPWYQGIEFFVGMRRLGKPAWMLNYNGEPHWAVKWQNRLDFNKRMFQFFNHYLKDEPMPKWMDEGVPVLEKGIRQGYELIKP